MAFSNTPEQDTYRTETVKFDQVPSLRFGSLAIQRDCNIINMYYDRLSQEDDKKRDTSLKKRPGLTDVLVSLNKTVSTASIRGYFYDPNEDWFYWAVGNKVWRWSPTITASYLAEVCTLATSSGLVGFDLFQKGTGETYVIFSDGTDLWYQQIRVLPGVTAVEVTDADLPSPHLPYPVVMDGYVFLAKNNTIYNSDVDTIDAWTPSNFIDCEMSSDNIKALVLNKNYVVALGQQSLEVFWNAANDTGSPLSRNSSGYKPVGFINSLARIGEDIFFVGQEYNKNVAVYKLKDFELRKISDEVVERVIQETSFLTSNVLDPATWGKHLSIDGHTFYCLTLLGITWVYEINDKIWYDWRDSSGNFLDIEASFTRYGGIQYVIMADRTNLSYFGRDVYQDFGVNFTCSYTTQELMFGSPNKKVCNRTALRCDRHLFSGTSLATIAWSDDDWSNGNTSSQQVNVFSNTPFARRCGQFINRSYRITYTDNYPFRMKELSLEINIGAH